MTTDDDAETAPSAPAEDIVVSVSGEIDMATTPPLLDAVGDAVNRLGDNGRIIFDVSQVTFMDSAGLKVIALACQSVPGRVVIRSPVGQVRRLLEVSGIGSFVDVQP